MKRLTKWAWMSGVMTMLLAGPACLYAQQGQGGGGPPGGGQGGPGGRGNFDPAQFRQMMMDRLKEQLEVTNDDEWKAIQPLIEKVTDAQRDVGFGGGMRGMFGRNRGGGGGPGGNDQGGARRQFGPQPSQAAQDLQAAIDAKSSSDVLKDKLAKYRDDRKTKETNLKAARENLRKVLSGRQEAMLVLDGVLD